MVKNGDMREGVLHQSDSILFWGLTFLLSLGLLMLFTSSSWLAMERTKSTTYYLWHQILNGFLPGIVVAYIASRLPLSFFKKLAFLFLILSFLLLILILFPNFNLEWGGAVRWLKIGPLILQPSEIAKLAIAVYFAALFERKIKEGKIKSFKDTLLPFFIILVIFIILLLKQPDMGTLFILFLIAFLMFFGAGGSFSHAFLFAIFGMALLAVGALVFPYQAKRILTFLNPEKDVLGMSYQVNQSLIAIGSGGIFGKGLGNGIQKYHYLPQPIGDTIFAVWAEETGFVGSTAVILLFLLICWRGFIISKKAPDKFSQLLALGITSWIIVQAFVHIMAVCGMIPFTGLPLPFVSYGGTALVSAITGVGILLNISRKTV